MPKFVVIVTVCITSAHYSTDEVYSETFLLMCT